uniref:Uncharacterized protein n=2 Tax=Cacopsylla melanoneura TaxID=428564 RepID=A0A8D8YT34_9HEMI
MGLNISPSTMGLNVSRTMGRNISPSPILVYFAWFPMFGKVQSFLLVLDLLSPVILVEVLGEPPLLQTLLLLVQIHLMIILLILAVIVFAIILIVSSPLGMFIVRGFRPFHFLMIGVHVLLSSVQEQLIR